MTHTSPVVLGLDFGTQRIGVARSYGQLAEPLIVLANDENLWQRLQQLVAEHQVSRVVVGMSEQQSALRTELFVGQLRQHLDVPVETTDETLSTQEARRRLAETKAGRRALGGPVDHYAAAAILEEWLDVRGVRA